MMSKIRTILGEIDASEMGVTLTHEHILVGFGPEGVKPDQYDQDEVTAIVLPYLKGLYDAGCRTLVECTPDVLGRDIALCLRLSRESGLNIIVPTGAYKEPSIPAYARVETPEQMAARWVEEVEKGVDGGMVGFIKIALEGKEMTKIEKNIFDAALLTSDKTGLVIICHCISAVSIREAMERMKSAGFDMEKFIWAHVYDTWKSAGKDLVMKAKELGMWLSVDNIGKEPHEEHIPIIKELWAENARLLLSQDNCIYVLDETSYRPPPYEAILTDFMPKLPAEMFEPIMVDNPAKAFRVR
jgi:phosphotriesterase-related protein